MNIVIISFGIIEYDGRLKELREVFSSIGHVDLISCSIGDSKDFFKIQSNRYLTKKNYFRFISYVLESCKRIKQADILVSDNLFSAFPVLLAKRILKPKYLIQDVRELYLHNESHGSTKIFTYFEMKLMRKADVVLAANEERARIMKEQYKLKKKPLVFENIRFLDGTFKKDILDKKYNNVFKYEFNIVSTSGLFMERDTDKLILAMKHLPEKFGLFFVGNSSDKDIAQCKELIRANGISNVHILGRVPMNELRYIVQQCQIGAVHYHKKNLNNKYCASGKIYEFMHEGLPVVTTENPPLKAFCERSKTGIADDLFYRGITDISENYAIFQNNVRVFISGVSIPEYRKAVADKIIEEISKPHIPN